MTALLDRRALALLAFEDAFGRPVSGPVRIAGAGVRVAAKERGRFALLEAQGLEAYAAAFATPSAPAAGSVTLVLDITPADGAVMPRRLRLPLPRTADPAQADAADSVFQPVAVLLPPSPRATLTGSAGAVRVTVSRADDGRRIEGALVRGRAAGGATAATLSDARGEACLVFPALARQFPGAGSSITATTEARILVDVDPASARFHAPDALGAAAREAAGRTAGHPDPDSLAAAFPPDFATGTPVELGAGRESRLALDWAAS